MRYISTRGQIEPVSFQEAVMMGLATDGGLLLPERLPTVDDATLDRWRSLAYRDLAKEVIGLFADDVENLGELIDRAYATFDHPEVTPVVEVGDLYVLELFHGPTLAFKDVALQLLGNLFESLLAARNGTMNILGATSGDTGSAAIHGVRGKSNINIFILHPHKRVSPIQELQMTTVVDANVFNIAIQGTFDDGQAIVKAIFNDIPFKERYRLGAINSINWARIVAQVVYYVYAALRMTERGPVDFAVPTGNFGDIFAGYVAARLMRGAIGRLILATNTNDLLTRFVNQGDYSKGNVVATSSPSMDIQVASNFERYLFYLNDCDAERTRTMMENFAATGRLSFGPEAVARVQRDFVSKSVSEGETIATIAEVYEKTGYLLDPHSAVGVNAAMACRRPGVPVVCLATAHPAKFQAAVERAIGRPPELPPSLRDLETRPRRCEILPAEVEVVQRYVADHALS